MPEVFFSVSLTLRKLTKVSSPAATVLAAKVPMMLPVGQAATKPSSAPSSVINTMLPAGPSGGWYSGMPGKMIRLMVCDVRP